MQLKNWRAWAVGLVIAAVLAILWPHDTAIVSFDQLKVRGQLIRQLAEHHASNEQVTLISTAFKRRLNQVLIDYAAMHHVVIVDNKLILAGSTDITDAIMLKLGKSS